MNKKYFSIILALLAIANLHLNALTESSNLPPMFAAALLLLVLWKRQYALVSVTALPMCWVIANFFPSWSQVLVVLISILIVLPFKKTRATLSWMRLGKIDKTSMVYVLIALLVAIGGLSLWLLWTDDLGSGQEIIRNQFSQASTGVLLFVYVPILAIINAITEEFYFRGIVQEALVRTIGLPWLVIVLQASVFGAGHVLHGFPNGILGYVMTFFGALVLGYLRGRTRGLLAPIIFHVGIDIFIFATLVISVRFV